ncbi:MAG TPA: hypothetical protein PLB55_15615 [Prosthecobacter sp.]|nr:hypothetical protein [Prosthecobacter sp.]
MTRFAGGVIHETDGFFSRDRGRGPVMHGTGWPGVQIHATCPLYLVWDTQKRIKLRSMCSLKRCREQRHGSL